MVKKTVEIQTKVTGEGQAKSKLGSLGDFIKKRLVVTLGDLANIGRSVIGFFVEASKNAQEQEKVTAKLNQALKNQGIFTQGTSKALQEQASALQKVTTFGDEAIITLQTQLINFGVLPKDIDRVTRATLDLASAQGMDLNTAGQLLSKSLGSSTNAMARYGIEITGAVGSTERLDSAIKNISAKFGGQAQADTETLAGATEQLKNVWGDLQETIMTTNNNAITPYVKGLTNILSKTNELISVSSQERTGIIASTEIIKTKGQAVKYLNREELLLAKQSIENLYKQNELLLLNANFKGQQRARAEEYNKQYAEYIKSIDKEVKAIDDAEEKKQKQAKNEAERIKKKEEDAQKQKEIDEAMVQASIDAHFGQNKALMEFNANQVKDAQETSDLLASITEDGGKTIGDTIKKQLSAQIDAWMAMEIAKAQAAAPLSFGASLLAIAPIIGAGTAGKAAINAVKFAQGGQFEAQPQAMQTTGGQTAISNEKGLEIHRVESIGRTQSSGGTIAPIIINLGGVELKRLAVDLKPYLNRGVS